MALCHTVRTYALGAATTEIARVGVNGFVELMKVLTYPSPACPLALEPPDGSSMVLNFGSACPPRHLRIVGGEAGTLRHLT